MPPIDFEAKTDRELLLLVAQTVNEMNERLLPAMRLELENHSHRLCKLETRRTLLLAAPGGGIGMGAAVYAIGKVVGWW